MAWSHFERLSAMDAAFLAIEDECSHMHIGSVSIFDPGPLGLDGGGVDIDRIRHLIGVQLHKTPRFRQKIARTPLSSAPVWIDDGTFNLEYHVRHTALPHPGGEAELRHLASRVMSQHLDRRRPLWELWVVEGLEGNRFALVSKVHHAMADGISGVDLASATIGRDPDFRPGPARGWIPRPAPSARELLRGELRHQLGTVGDLLRGGPGRGREGRGDGRGPGAPGDSWSRRLQEAVAAVSAVAESAPETPLNREIGPNRRFAWRRTPLAELNEIREAAGAKLNDVVLAAVAGAVRGFLLRRGSSVRGLDFRVMVPVSVRTEDERGQLGNRVSQLLVHLPLDTEGAFERLRVLQESTRELKQSGQAEGGRIMSEVLELLPAVVVAPLQRLAVHRSFGNMVVTNVPGPPFTAYMLGARLLESYPLVPLAPAQALGVAVLSYDTHLHWGINADYDLVPDIEDFVALLGEEVGRLLDEARRRSPHAAPEARTGTTP